VPFYFIVNDTKRSSKRLRLLSLRRGNVQAAQAPILFLYVME
jgi:hypothetical protein